jgi:tetratricopeptide (TPR) repeat protein
MRGGATLPFTGRAPEAELLRNRADNIGANRHTVQLVRGPAGIGKTRLVREALVDADVRPIWVRCWDDSSPLWPWRQVLAQLGRDCEHLFTSDSSKDRLATFSAMLAELDRGGPIIVVIDDIHLSDHATLLFTRFIARAEPPPHALFVITARPGGELDDSRRTQLDELARDADEFPLGHLGHDDVVELLRAGGVDHDDASLIDALVALTGGLPLAIERTVLALDDVGEHLPDLGSSVEHAARALSPGHRALLAAAATYGPTTTISELRSIAGCTEPEAFEALEVGQLVGLVASGANITFSHESIRESVGGWLSPADRISVHRNAVTALRGGPVQQLPIAAAHASALAGVDTTFASDAVELSLAAAQFFESVDSLEAALDSYDQAAQLSERSGGVLPIDRQLAHADAALGAGRLTRARQLYQLVATAAELSGDAMVLADAAAGLGGVWLGEHRSDDIAASVRALQERALEAVAPVDANRALRLRVRLAGEASFQTREVADLEGLLDEVRESGTARMRAEALSIMIHAKLGPRDARHRLELVDEMTAAAAESGDPVLALLAQCWKAVSLAMIADDRAHRARRMLELRCLTIRCASVQFIVEAMAVGRLINAGRFDEAEVAAAQCFEFGQSVGDADAWTYYAGHLAHIRFSQGRHGELAEFATDAAQSPVMLPSERALAATAAMCALHVGERGPADRIIALHRSSPGMESYHPSTWLIAMHVTAHLAFQLDDPALGRDIASQLEPFRGLPLSISMAVSDLGWVDWPYGMALAASGDLEGGEAALATAIDLANGRGDRPNAAIVTADRALLLHRIGKVVEARSLLADALAEAEQLAMTGWVTTWSGWLESWGTVPPGPAKPIVFERIDASHWTCTFRGHSSVYDDTVGLRHLAALCAAPGTGISASRLAYLIEPNEAAQAILDSDAIDALRARVNELRLDLDEEVGDRSTTEDELEAVSAQLLEALGLSDSRRFNDAGERARTSVRKAITRSIAKIADVDPELAAHLGQHVQTGYVCRYDSR